jgi:hypothetical protein
MKKLFFVVLLTFVLSGCFGLYSNNSITSLGNMSNTQLQHEYRNKRDKLSNKEAKLATLRRKYGEPSLRKLNTHGSNIIGAILSGTISADSFSAVKDASLKRDIKELDEELGILGSELSRRGLPVR